MKTLLDNANPKKTSGAVNECALMAGDCSSALPQIHISLKREKETVDANEILMSILFF